MADFGAGPGRKWLAVAILATLGLAVPLPVASEVFLRQSGLANRHPGAERTWQWASYKTADLSAWPPSARRRTDRALQHGMIGGGLAGLLLFGLAGKVAFTRQNKGPLHGRSDFATNREIKQAGIRLLRRPDPDSIVLGRRGPLWLPGRLASSAMMWSLAPFLFPWVRYLCFGGSSHVSLAAMTEAGKGIGFVLPNCLNWEGSLISFDIKGELWRKTAGRRARMGQKVFCFAPTAPHGRSHRYNPYSVVDRSNPGEAIDMIHRINSILIPTESNAKTDPYFQDSARNAINGIATILALTPGAPLHIGAVRDACIRADYQTHLRGYIQRARKEGRPLPASAVKGVEAWIDNKDDRGRNGIQSTIDSKLGLWASPKVVAATEASDFDLRQIRKQPMSIYLWLRPTEMRRFRPLTAILFQQLIDLNTDLEFGQHRSHRCKVLMMLDEFWACGPMTILADSSAFVRAYGIRMAYVMQTWSQIVSIYGQEGADNLIENTKAEIVFGVKGNKAAKEISEKIGFDTVEEKTVSGKKFGRLFNSSHDTQSRTARRRAEMLPQEVQRLSPKKEVIFVQGIPAIMAQRVSYYSEPVFASLEERTPNPPKLNVTIENDTGQATAAPAVYQGAPQLTYHVQANVPGLGPIAPP